MRSSLFSSLSYFYRFYCFLKKRPLKAYCTEKEATIELSRAKLEKKKLAKLKDQLIWCYKEVPYYKEAFDRLQFNPYKLTSFQEFDELDFYLTKDDLKRFGEEIVKPNIRKKSLNWHKTGGSTGEPLLWATDNLTDTGSLSSIMRALSWFGTMFGRKHVIIWGSPTYVFKGRFSWLKRQAVKVRDRLMGRLFISNYDLSESNFDAHAKQIIAWKPEYIRGMASSLYVFCELAQKKGYDFSALNIKVVHSACEQLFSYQRELISNVFNCKVANTYGLSEVCDVAYECPEGHLHISEEDVYVQLLNHSVNDNLGEIVLTQLNNRACPLVKYKTSDLCSKIDNDKQCIYGGNLAFFHELNGRTHDIVRTKSGINIHGQYFTHIILSLNDIASFQVIQSELWEIRIKIVSENNLSEQKEKTIERELFNQISNDFPGEFRSIRVDFCDVIEKTPSGKHRWVINNVDKT